ncbi:MAG TPA: PAS domain S-box protein, partial [Bacteroidota bacterium]|nr:PAS domain S-box protein [Bacteroidota bacterium]
NVPYEHIAMRKDGSRFPVETRGYVLNEHGTDLRVTVIRDFTARKEADRRLRESHERIIDILESMTEAFISLDAEWRITYVNVRAAQIYNRNPAEMIGRTLAEEFPEVIGTSFHRAFAVAMNEHRDGLVEDFYQPFKRWFEARVFPVRGGISIFFSDISERKIAELEKEEQKKRFELIVEASNVGLWYWDIQKNTVFFSNEWKRLLGFKEKEISDSFSAWEGRVHPDDLSRLRQDIQRHLANPASDYEVEYRFKRKDGTYRNILSRAGVIRDEFQNPLRMVGCHIDITERKRTEHLLEAELNVLELVSTGAPIESVLLKIVESVEQLSADTIGSVLLLDPDGVHVHTGAAPRLPEAYNRALEGRPIGPHAGSCGTSAFLKKSVIVTDTETDPLWEDYRQLAREHHLRACWSTPIMNSDGLVLGTFAMYYREPRKPTPDDFKLIERATHLAAIALEQHRTERIVRDSETRLRRIVEGTQACLFTTDTRGRFTYLNDAAARVLGESAERLRGRLYLKFVHPDDRPRVHELFTSQLSGKIQSRYAEFRFESADGRTGWLSFFVNLLMSGANVAGLTGVAQEITERKKSEEGRLHREQMLSSIYDTVGDVIFQIAVEPEGEFRFTTVNRAFIATTGLTPEDVIGRRVSEVVPKESLSSVVARYQESIQNNRIVRWEETSVYPTGKLTGEVSVAPIFDKTGKCTHLVGAVHDITLRKQAEAALRASKDQLRALADRLQAAREEERTHIAREIHDELGQMLTGLKMDVSWIGKQLPADLPKVTQRAASMKELIDTTIVSVRKIASELRPGVLDSLGLIAAIEWQAAEFQKRTDIRCEFKCGTFDYEIDRDRSTALFRILQETLTNVARHAKASKVSIELKSEDDRIVLIVQDNGRGVTERELEQQESLGLLGMRERAESFKGELRISGIPGKGTLIRVEIPRTMTVANSSAVLS